MGLFLPLLIEEDRVYGKKAHEDFEKNAQSTCF